MLQEFPGVDVLVLSSSVDGEMIRMAMGLGGWRILTEEC